VAKIATQPNTIQMLGVVGVVSFMIVLASQMGCLKNLPAARCLRADPGFGRRATRVTTGQ
jgi:hypothetical protein